MNAQQTIKISKATGLPVRIYNRKPKVVADRSFTEAEEVVAMLLPPPIQVAEPESEVEVESEESESEESETDSDSDDYF